MILMDVRAHSKIQPGDPPSYQVFFNSDPAGAAVGKLRRLGAATIDQCGKCAAGPGCVRTLQKDRLAVAHIYKSDAQLLFFHSVQEIARLIYRLESSSTRMVITIAPALPKPKSRDLMP